MKKINKEKKLPKTILGLELPFKNTIEDKKVRIKYYLKDSVAFAIMITIIDLFAIVFIENYNYLKITNNITINYVITLILDFIFIFIITFFIDYIFAEDGVKKYNNY